MMTTRLLSKKGLTYMKALELSQGFKTTMNSDSPVPLCAVEMGGEAAGRLLVMAGETAGRLLVMAGETIGRFPITGSEVRQTDSMLMSPWCKPSSVTPSDINIAGLRSIVPVC